MYLCHLIPCKVPFIGNIVPQHIPIEVANGTIIYSEGKGDVRKFWKSSETSTHLRPTVLRGVLYVPSASISLISLGELASKGSTLAVDSNSAFLYNKDGKFLLWGILSNMVYAIPQPKEIASSAISSANLLHQRLGHPAKQITLRIPNAVKGMT